MKTNPRFKLEVAVKALDFVGTAQRIVDRLPRKYVKVGDQLSRAAIGCALNIAEGAAEFSRDEKMRLYRLARREADECAMALDILVKLKAARPDEMDDARALLNEISGMLT